MNFIDKLSAAWTANHSLLCVGLDPDLAKLPAELRDAPDGITTFCTRIIDATADLACAFKPQIAYFAALGAEKQLEDICLYLREHYPGREDEVRRTLEAYQPIGRMGTPEEVAALALYLCSDEAAFVTGQAYPIDGGVLVA